MALLTWRVCVILMYVRTFSHFSLSPLFLIFIFSLLLFPLRFSCVLLFPRSPFCAFSPHSPFPVLTFFRVHLFPRTPFPTFTFSRILLFPPFLNLNLFTQISRNQFAGVVPIPGPQVRYYIASYNQFKSLSTSFGTNCPFLSLVDFSHNSLTGYV